ncbi:MAG: efflux RND transporter periplasmic adaptor subunit [Arcobacteraceae bacterium]
MYCPKVSMILLSLVTVLFFTACETKEDLTEEKPSVKVVKVLDLNRSVNHDNYFSYPAEIFAFQDVTMAFELDGKITDFYYKEGQRVKKGSVIAKLDDTIYKANYDASEANYNQAKLDFQRYTQLFRSKSVSKSDLDKKKQTLDVTKAKMQIAKKNLEETQLIAEFDGVVAKKMVDDFARVTEKQPIVRLQDTASYKIKFFVPENDIQLLKGEFSTSHISELVNFFITIGNDKETKYDAQLLDISTTAEKVTRTFESTLQMKHQNDITILPGMTAKVTVVVKNGEKNRVFIPFRAVFSDHTKKSFVWVIDENNRVIKQEVMLGELSDEKVEILRGVETASKIVTSGVRFLEPNDEVKEYEKIGD